MVHIAVSVQIDTTPDRVWEFIRDPERYPAWMDFVDAIHSTSEDSAGRGMTYRFHGGFTPLKSEQEWRIVDWDPPRWQSHQGDLTALEPVLAIELEPNDDGTTLNLSLEFEFLPRYPRIGWWLEVVFVRQLIHLLVGWPMKSSLRATARNVKQEVEQENRGGKQ